MKIPSQRLDSYCSTRTTYASIYCTGYALYSHSVAHLQLCNLSEDARNYLEKEGYPLIKHAVEVEYDHWTSGLSLFVCSYG